MEKGRPLGVTLIGYFYIFGAVVLLFTFSEKLGIGLNITFGVPYLSETIVKIFLAIFSIIMAYGYLNMKKWGYWTFIIYSVLFLIICLTQKIIYNNQLFIYNSIFLIITIIYTFIKRYKFFNDKDDDV
jgi:hypothetical protein